MSTTPAATTATQKLRAGVFSADHKAIGLNYLWLGFAAVAVGLSLSIVMRLHLIWPQLRIPLMGELKPEDYLGVMTMHATFMVFFVVTLIPQSAFANFLLPLEIGAREMCFPRLNALAFWITAVSFFLMFAVLFVPGGSP